MSHTKLEQKWAEADANPGKSVDIGRIVVCDACNDDYTDSLAIGGLIAGSYAYCPKCVDSGRFQFSAREIRARCPTLTSFGDFVRHYRGPDGNKITIHAGPPTKPAPRFSNCIECKAPFTDKNTHSTAGWRETQMSGLCEDCFDAVFADMEDDE